MICPKCKHNNPEGSKFCYQCAAELPQPLVCPRCGCKDIPLDSNFCPDCGSKLNVPFKTDNNASTLQQVRELFEQGEKYHSRNLYTEAVKYYRQAAELGYSKAQVFLGQLYENGLGVLKSNNDAVMWYKKAADQGLADAQYMLGRCYIYGRGVKKDDLVAIVLFKSAAKQGNAKAQYMLGKCYEKGWGVKKDVIESHRWYRIAEETERNKKRK